MERAAFPGQKKMLPDTRHCTLQLSGLQRNSSRQPYIYGPTDLMSLKGCRALAIRTFAISRQPVDNQSEVLVASVCQRSRLFLGCRRSASGLYLPVTGALTNLKQLSGY